MKDLNKSAFISLFKEACEKCFGFPLTSPLSESDSKLLSNKIFEQTGLVIGAKSIKNYSLFIPNSNSKESRHENPSVSTLDTLARYVLDAPYTDEVQRKDNESHYPYWFQYRNRFSGIVSKPKKIQLNWKRTAIISFITLIIIIGLYEIITLTQKDKNEYFTDNFDSVSGDSLVSRGWIIKSADSAWWNKRNEKPGHLALYTLRGDNWALGENPSGIKNLLLRRVTSDCFMVEIHLTNFIPEQNWQQAGLLLSEDSTFTGKMLRLSISFNDFFGGFVKPPEILIQAISSSESGLRSKPEEIAHLSLFNLDPGKKSLVENNLAKSALKIEKKGSHFRFLYSASPMESFTFREAVSGDFNIQPKYVGIFSIQGWADNRNYIPAYFDSFAIMSISCYK
ncbi:MAG: hypothetical protein NTV31_09390 [Bacteroidia bacterium]|nr:hypothetical protein [Bacteroidia bacterium]